MTSKWNNRIVEQGAKPASQFQAHPNNFRTHPQSQRRAVRASLDSLGWVNVVIENAVTGNLIDGHERVWNALKNGDSEVPYIQVELTEAEEAQALLSLDPIAAMAGTDAAKMDELLKQVETDNEDLTEFLTELAKSNGIAPINDDEWADAFGSLPDEERAPFRQMTFTLHDIQADQVKEALSLSKSLGEFVDSENENSNGNALARICELFVMDHGQS